MAIIILHEMGHVLGLVNKDGTKCQNPCGRSIPESEKGTAIRENSVPVPGKFGCQNKTLAEYAKLNLGRILKFQRIEYYNKITGEFDYSSCNHWDASSFVDNSSSELMTPRFIKFKVQSLSRVTVAALDQAATDYVVDYDAADPFPFKPKDSNARALRSTSSFSIIGEEEGEKSPVGFGRRLHIYDMRND